MQILRVLVLSSLAASITSVMAQSLPGNNSPAKPDTYSFLPSQDLHLPAKLPQYVFRGAQSNLGSGNNLPHLTLNPKQDGQLQTYLRLLSPNLSQNRLLPQKNSRCYAIRSYRFNRDSPASEATDLAEYSTCQSAADFQMKAALDVHTR